MKMQLAEQENAPIRALIVDDHVILRQGICVMLSEDSDFDVVGEAEHEREALLLAMELQPNIILIDICLGTTNGLDLAKQLLRSCPNTYICCTAVPIMMNFSSMLYESAYMASCKKHCP